MARVGETLDIRYSARNPELATVTRSSRLLSELLVFGLIFGVGGLVVVGGSLAGLINGDHRLFYGVAGTGFLALIGCMFAYIAVQSYGKVRSAHQRVVADGTVSRVEASGTGGKYPHPWISYKTLDRRDIEYQDTSLTGYDQGEKVTVYYDPEYPEFTSTATDKSGHAGQAIFYGAVGLFCIGACGWSAWTHLIT